MTRYMRWLAVERGRDFGDYMDMWRWSVRELDEFWATIWDYFDVAGRPAPRPLLASEIMPGAIWCPGQKLNYASHLLRGSEQAASTTALLCAGEDDVVRELSWRQLIGSAGALANHLRESGVGPGDRVVGYLPNTEEPIIALIACASIGAIWSVCSPDYGTGGVLARFGQLEPKVLIATTGYRFGGKDHDRVGAAVEIADSLTSLDEVIWVGDPARAPKVAVRSRCWPELTAAPMPLVCDPLPFDHPLWVLFSSGTTGIPKGVVHGHGGILLEHLKSPGRPGRRACRGSLHAARQH